MSRVKPIRPEVQVVDGLQFLTMVQVMKKVGLAELQIRDRVQQGTFPAPRRVGGGARFLSSEVEEWMLAQPVERGGA